MKLNLDDIAKLAGVSRATASRVINHHPDVSAGTREKVLKVIEANHYQPNLAARMLVTQRTQIIGIVIQYPEAAFVSEYVPILMDGVNAVTERRDYAVLMWWEHAGVEKDHFAERILAQKRLMDGMIITVASIVSPLIDHMIESNIPFVMMERPTRHVDQISYVTIDNCAGAKTAVEHLIQIGRRRIAHITGTLNNIDGQDRLKSYRATLEEHGLPVDPALIADASFNRRSGYLAMKELLSRGVDIDAVFAGNDNSAEGALQAMHETGIRVPDDVALVGFDDVPTARDLNPQLTTIHQSIVERGSLATNLLLDIIEGKVTEPQQIILPTRLVIRRSTGGVNSEERSEEESEAKL
jgi:LacI family transcriptional regulator